MESTGLTKEKVEAFVNEKWPGILKSLEGKSRSHLTRLHPNWQLITCLRPRMEYQRSSGRSSQAHPGLGSLSRRRRHEGRNYQGEGSHSNCLHRDRSGINRNILMYGHFDKQPPFEGWNEGLAPTKPVLIGDKLYGRGGADDGYAIYGSIMSVLTC